MGIEFCAGLFAGVIIGYALHGRSRNARLTRLEEFYMDSAAQFQRKERDLLDRVMAAGNASVYQMLQRNGKPPEKADRAKDEMDDYSDMQFGGGPFGGDE